MITTSDGVNLHLGLKEYWSSCDPIVWYTYCEITSWCWIFGCM